MKNDLKSCHMAILILWGNKHLIMHILDKWQNDLDN